MAAHEPFGVDQERTAEGWTPICYAAVDGSPMLIASLVEQGGADERVGLTV